MAVTSPNKNVGTVLRAWADLATGNVEIGADVDVSTKISAAFGIRIARRSGTAFTAGWPNIRIEGSFAATGNDAWSPLLPLQAAIGAAIANTTLNGAVSAGATSIVVTVNTNIVAGDILFLGHTTDTTKYELIRVKSVSGTTITPEEAVTYAHDTGAPVTDQAEIYAPEIGLEDFKRIRYVIDNGGSGQLIAVRIVMNTCDSYGT